jgi:hypothetical protein
MYYGVNTPEFHPGCFFCGIFGVGGALGARRHGVEEFGGKSQELNGAPLNIESLMSKHAREASKQDANKAQPFPGT